MAKVRFDGMCKCAGCGKEYRTSAGNLMEPMPRDREDPKDCIVVCVTSPCCEYVDYGAMDTASYTAAFGSPD